MERTQPRPLARRADQHTAKFVSIRIACLVVFAVCPAGAVAYGQASGPDVTIEGGPDASGDNYAWTVTNGYTSPIVYVEFPHYHATLFFAPDGWTTQSTFLVNVGVKDTPGICTATAATKDRGISPGRSGVFRMRVHQGGTRHGTQTVLVRFADGREVNVPGVRVAVPEALSDRFGPLIGLGALFVLLVVIQAVRRRRARRSDAQIKNASDQAGRS